MFLIRSVVNEALFHHDLLSDLSEKISTIGVVLGVVGQHQLH